MVRLRTTPEQQALMDVMLDTHCPTPERTEAGQRLAASGDPRPGVGLRTNGLPDIAWVELPGGTFLLGRDGQAFKRLPARQVETERLWLARYPGTNVQWQAFLDDPAGYQNAQWWAGLAGGQQEPAEPRWSDGNHPREMVNWYEAVDFYRWLSNKVGYEVRLPTEVEWERAAHGGDRRLSLGRRVRPLAASENPNIRFVCPKEGGVIWQDNMVIPAT